MGTLWLPELDLEVDARGVRRGGRTLELAPAAHRLLLYLANNGDRVVPKAELLQQVWDAHVTDGSLYQALHVLRRAIGEAGGDGFVRAVRGRGYQLATRVERRESPEDRHHPPLVGRERTMRSLASALERAREGSGRLLLLSGPPGIGKTRLLDEAADLAARRGFQVVRGGGLQDDARLPLWPFEQMLGELVSRRPGHLAGLAESERSALCETFPALGAGPAGEGSLEPSAARFRLFEAVWRLLRIASEREPLLLTLDDLHRADALSLRLVEWIATRLSGVSALVATAYRDAPVHLEEGFRASVARLLATPSTAHEALGHLSPDDVATLVEKVRGSAPSAEALESLCARSGGNPLFLRALLFTEDGDPAEARTTALAHLAALTPETRSALAVASIVGLEWDVSFAAALCGETAEAWGPILEEARALHLVRAHGGSCAFTHALVWEALHAELSAERRSELHARAAELLVARGVHDDVQRTLLADHAARAVPRIPAEQAAAHCIAAAEASSRRLAFEEADRLFTRAAELLADGPPAEHLAALVALAENRARLGDVPGVRTVLEPAVERAVALGDGRAHTRLVLALATARGDSSDATDAEVIALLERAAASHPEPTPERARLLACLSHEVWFVPPRERARALAEEAAELARRLGDPETTAQVLIRAYRVLQTGIGDDPVRARIAEDLERALDRVPERLMLLEAELTLVWESLARGDRPGVERWVARMERDAQRAGVPHATWWALVGRASRAHLQGEFAVAEALAEEGVALGRSIGLALAVPNFLLQMLAIRGDQGRLSELESPLAEGHRASPPILGWELGWKAARAAGGQPGPARELLRDLVASDFRRVADDVSKLNNFALITDLAERLEDRDAARLALRILAPARHRHIVLAAGFCHRGSVAHHLGRLAEVQDDPKAAERWYAEGIERDRQLGALPYVARGQVGQGRVLLRRGAAQRERGLRLLEEGGGLARDLGMAWLEERAARSSEDASDGTQTAEGSGI